MKTIPSRRSGRHGDHTNLNHCIFQNRPSCCQFKNVSSSSVGTESAVPIPWLRCAFVLEKPCFLMAEYMVPPGFWLAFPPPCPSLVLSSLSPCFSSSLCFCFSLSLSNFKTLQPLLFKNWWLMPSRRGSSQIATAFLFFYFFCLFFVLKLSSRITEPAGLLPAQRDREQREEDEKPSRSDERKPNPREALWKGEETLLKPLGWEADTALSMCCFHCPHGVICPAKQVTDNMIWMFRNKCVSVIWKITSVILYWNRRNSTIFENNCSVSLASSSDYSIYIVTRYICTTRISTCL